MKCVTTITLLYFLTAVQCYQYESETWRVRDIANIRSKRAPRTTTVPPVAAKPNPCDPFVSPPRPDFSRGRRISEAECLGFVWEMKVRKENETHEEGCNQHLAKLWGRRFIIGGREALPGEFPHMGALGWRAVQGTWIFKCGSSLISPKFVVTAAHCSRISRADTSISDPVPKIVRLGDKNIKDVEINGSKPVDVRISRIIVHPQYASPKQYYDIALVELAERVTFTKFLQPACLWSQFDTRSLGPQATVTGWGFIDAAKTTTTPVLQVATLDFVDQNQCGGILKSLRIRHFNGLQPHQICAGKLAGRVDACQGDSGGPLQKKISLPMINQGSIHHLVGITSFGVGCARPNTPGVYTRVASFIDWIEGIVWPHKKAAIRRG